MTQRQYTTRSASHLVTLVVLQLTLLGWGACLPPGVLAAPRVAQAPPPGPAIRHAIYQLPTVKLRDDTGHTVDLPQWFAGPRPLIVNFIFTSCPEICPVMTGTQLQLQRLLRNDPAHPLFVSITLDPDQDTPEVLADYADRYGADWKFLTGGRTEVLQTLQAFDVWRGNKMNHAAVTLMRRRPGTPWTRIEGLAPAAALAQIWHETGP